MKRSTWTAVLATALVLAAAGTLPRVFGNGAPLARTAGAWAGHVARATEARVVVTSLVVRARLSGLHVTPVPPAPAGALATAGAGALLLAGLAWSRARVRRRPPRRPAHRVSRALGLAREGRDAASIARELGLAQDAVRALLRPAPERRERVRGRLVAR